MHDKNDEEIPSLASEIKYAPLNRFLPANNELRDYLATKEETGVQVNLLTPNRVRVREPFGRWPRTLLLMPPITLSEGTVKRVIPPLGLSYIAGYLESQDIPFEMLDCVVEGLQTEQLIGEKTWIYGLTDQEIAQYLQESRPEVLGISIIYSSDLHSMFRIAALTKELLPETVVVAGGIHPSIYPREVLLESKLENKPTIDYVIRGEGEIRFARFLKELKEGQIDLNADGLCGWHGDAMFINPQLKTIADLDALPLPAYHRLPMEKYFDFNVPFSPFPQGNRVMQLYTSRGCPIGCTFCASTNFNKAFRQHSPDHVIDEIMYYKERYKIDEIQFADDNLTFNRKRSMEFFEKLKSCGLKWCTPNGTLINSLTKEMLDKMIESGLYQLTLSLDSGSAKTLKEHHRKPVDLTRVPDLCDYLKKRGILIHMTLVVGMPGESEEDIDEGFRYVETLPIDSIGVFIAQALPGSELFERAVVSGAIDRKKARIIDTTQNNITLSDIPKKVLEKKVAGFIYRYNQIIKERDPVSWEFKYKKHQHKLKHICIGRAAPNTDGIIRAVQPTPMETPAQT